MKAKDWVKKLEQKKFENLTCDNNNLKKLQDIGMDKNNIQSFLNLYKENKRLAVWTVNKNAKIFNINAPKEAFNIRKLTLINNKEKVNKKQVEKNLPDFYLKQVKNWVKMKDNNKFEAISCDKFNMQKLKSLGMNSQNIVSFLNMYKENKKLAVWTVNNNAKIFNIKTPETAFNIRKLTLTNNKEKSYEKTN